MIQKYVRNQLLQDMNVFLQHLVSQNPYKCIVLNLTNEPALQFQFYVKNRREKHTIRIVEDVNTKEPRFLIVYKDMKGYTIKELTGLGTMFFYEQRYLYDNRVYIRI